MAIAELSSPSSLSPSPSPSPSAEWDTLGNTEAFYRRTLLYSLDLVLPGGGDLSDYLLAGARNGGPLAITRDDSKPVLLKEAASSSSAEGGAGRDSRNRKRVWLYTSAGTLIQSIVWDHSAKLVKFGFTTNESLVLLGRDGVYRLYPISPALSSASSSSSSAYSQHSLTHDVGEDAFISDARIYEGGMLILLSTHQFLEVKGWPERDDALVAADAWDAGQSPAAGSSRAASAGLGTIYGKGRVERLVDSGLERAPSAWCVLTPEQSTSRQAEVLMSSGEALLVVDQLEVQDQRFSRGPFSHIVPSPSGRFMALLTVSALQRLYVVSSNYSETLSEYSLADEPETGPPKSVKWCGNNSVVLAWESTVVMVGPYGQTLRYYYTDPIHLVNEVDGVRIISIDKCEFLQKVPPSTVAVFSPGSSHPSAILFEAYNEFSARSAHSHESIISIRPDLVEAVDTCIDAAAREVDPAWQKKLLKAAGFGKTFLDSYNPIDFVNVAQALRVLNAVRHYEIGIPITYDQYLTQSPASLVARLILRSRHLLALRISGFLKLSASPVLRHWARQKVTLSKNEPDDAAAVCDLIVRRLRDESDASSTTSANARVGTGTGNGFRGSDVSCADVARTAWDQGKVALATRLLEHEARASKQVHLLLSMREDNLALLKATQSGDSDLILSVLLSLRKQHSLGTFFRFLDNKPEAAAVLANYGRRYDRELIRDYWYQDDRRTESACFDLEEAARIGVAMPGAAAIVGAPPGAAPGSASADTAASREALTAEQFGERMDKVRSAMKTFGEDKERGFEARICDEHLKLLAFQQTLQSEAGAMSSTPPVGLSVNETIRQCLVHGWGKKAEKLRADFKVPDKRWWYVKVKALTETRDWEALDQFVRSKSRPPIPLEAVVDHLIATGNPRQAIKYVPKCEGRNRPELFVKAGEWVKAGEECRDRGDRAKLQDLINRAPNNLLGSQLASMLEDTRSF